MAASGIIFELAGASAARTSILSVGVDETTIAGLNGTSFTTVEGKASMRTLIVNGGGTFAGTMGANLHVKKRGSETLTLSGATTTFTGDFAVEGGTLQLTGFGNLKGMVDLSNGASFIYEGAGTWEKALSGTGNITKQVEGVVVMKNVTGAVTGDILVKGGELHLSSSGTVGNTFGSSLNGVLSIGKGAKFNLLAGDGFVINKNVLIEDGGTLYLQAGNNSVIKGTLEVKGSTENLGSTIEYANITSVKTVSIEGGLTGSGTLMIYGLGNANPGHRILTLDGDDSDNAEL